MLPTLRQLTLTLQCPPSPTQLELSRVSIFAGSSEPSRFAMFYLLRILYLCLLSLLLIKHTSIRANKRSVCSLISRSHIGYANKHSTISINSLCPATCRHTYFPWNSRHHTALNKYLLLLFADFYAICVPGNRRNRINCRHIMITWSRICRRPSKIPQWRSCCWAQPSRARRQS